MAFVKDVSINSVKTIILLLAGITTSIIMARGLGPTGKGIYALVMLAPSLITQFGKFGLGMANTYYTGKKKIKLSILSSNSFIFGLINGIFLVFIFLMLYPFVKDSMFKGVNSYYIYIILIMIPFSFINIYLDGIIVGLLKIKQSSYITIVHTLIITVGMAIILLFTTGYIFELLFFIVIVTISFSVFYYFYIDKLTGFVLKFSWKSFKKCFNYGSKGYLANVFMFFNYRLDMFMINFFVGVTSVGYYSLSVGIAEMIWIVPQTIGFVLFPTVSSTNKIEGADITAASCRHSFFLSSVLCSCAVLFGKYAIDIIYGKNFIPSYLPLLILLPGILINSTGTLTSSYLNGIGKVIYSPVITSTGLIINIILNIILIPIYGIIGAGIASSICYSYCAFLGVFFFIKHSNIRLKDIYIIKKDDLLLYIQKIKDYKLFKL